MRSYGFYFLFQVLLLSCASVRPPTAPSWMKENCTKNKNDYLFTSMGQGDDLGEASLMALKKAKISAGHCLFGGSFRANTKVEKSMKRSRFHSTEEFTIKEDHINWDSFEKVANQEEIRVIKGKTFVFHTYRWQINAINREKSRAQKLKEALEEKRTLGLRVEELKKLNDSKAEELSRLKEQETRMRSYTDDIQRALASISNLKKIKSNKSKSIRRLFANLPCGITIGEIIQHYKVPDSYVVERDYFRWASTIKIYWGEMVIKMTYKQIGQTTGRLIEDDIDDDDIYQIALEAKPDFVQYGYGQSGWGYKICDLKS